MSPISRPAMQQMLPHWLRRLFTSGRPTPYGVLNYESKLLAAEALSSAWGLRPPRATYAPLEWPQTARSVIYKHLECALGHLDPNTVAAQRFELILLVRDLLVRELRVPALLTAGFVYRQGERLNYTPIELVEKLLRAGTVVTADFPLHVWLTLPTHVVVDATFWAEFPSRVSSKERARRGAIFNPAFAAERSYHPQWVGEGIARSLGLLKEREGW